MQPHYPEHQHRANPEPGHHVADLRTAIRAELNLPPLDYRPIITQRQHERSAWSAASNRQANDRAPLPEQTPWYPRDTTCRPVDWHGDLRFREYPATGLASTTPHGEQRYRRSPEPGPRDGRDIPDRDRQSGHDRSWHEQRGDRTFQHDANRDRNENRKRQREEYSDGADDGRKRQRTEPGYRGSQVRPLEASRKTLTTLRNCLGRDNPFDHIGPPARGQEEWQALRIQYARFVGLIEKNILPNCFHLSKLSSVCAHYLNAARQNRCAIREIEKPLFHRLIDAIQLCMEHPGNLGRVNAITIGSFGNALKAALGASVHVGEKRKLQKAYRCFMGLTSSSGFDNAEAQQIANVGNALKAAVDARLLDDEPDLIKHAWRRVLQLILTPQFDNANAQHIANVGNALKAAVDAKLLDDDPRLLKQAWRRVLQLILTPQFDDANAQHIANVGNALKAVVDAKLLDDDPDLLKLVWRRFLQQILTPQFDDADAQAIANLGNALKTVVDAKLFDDDPRLLKQAWLRFLQQILTSQFAGANAQQMANVGNALKAAVDAKLLVDDPELFKQAWRRFLQQILTPQFDDADAQAMANVGNALKAVVDARLLDDNPELLKQAWRRFLQLTLTPQFDDADAQAMANVGNALKAVVDAKLLDDDLRLLKQAWQIFLQHILTPHFDNANAQAIANVGNALKAAVDAKLLDGDPRLLKQAWLRFLQQILMPQFDDADAQAIANLGNALKAVVDARLLDDDPRLLKQAWQRFLHQILTPRFNAANAQEIANVGNALKTVVDTKLLDDDPELLKQAWRRFLHQILTPHFDDANAQAVANVGNALKAAVDARLLEDEPSLLKQAWRRFLQHILTPQFDDADAQEIANVFNSIRAAVYGDLLSAEQLQALRPQLQRLLHLCSTQTMSASTVQQLSNILKSVVFFHRHSLLDTDTVAAVIKPILAHLDVATQQQSFLPLARAMVLMSLVAFYTKLAGARKKARTGMPVAQAPSPATDLFLKALLPQLLAHIQAFPVEQVQADDRAHLRRFGLACHNLYRFLDRSKRRRANAPFAQPIRTFLAQRLVPHQHKLVQQVMADAILSVNMLDLTLSSMYRPDLKIALPFTPLCTAQIQDITAQSHAALNHPPGPLQARRLTIPIPIPILDLRGKQIGQQTLDSSLFQAMSHGRWRMPVFMKITHQVKGECLPVFARHDGQLYRFDVFGGSKLKSDLMRDDYGMLIGIPVDAASFFNQEWLTSQEAYVYAQRAFMPETVGTAEKPYANRGLSGSIALGIIPDAQARQLALMDGPYGALQVKDGCGFIKASLAAKGGLASVHARAPAVTRPAHLPAQALQYYRLGGTGKHPAAETEAQAIVQELLADAKTRLGKPLRHWTDAQLRQASLHAALTIGDPQTVMATIVPGRGDRVLLPDTDAWRALAGQGLILGRNPYDSKNLYVVPPQDIAFSSMLAGPGATSETPRPTVFQYTLTGIERIADAGTHRTHSFKGMLMVVPDEYWPAEFADQDVLVSSKDQKLCNAWHSAEDKKQAQAPAQTMCLVINGHLVHKEDRTRQVIAVPPAIADKLAADYDGDEFNVLTVAGHAQLAAHITRKNRKGMDNPKQPKTFTPSGDEVSRRDRILQLRQPLVAHWSTASDGYHALPKAVQTQVAQDLVHEQVIESALPQVWDDMILPLLDSEHGAAEEPPYTNQEARKVVHREIALGIKVGTDAEKTTVPFDDFLARGKAFQKALRPHLPAAGLPYGKGFRRRLELAARHEQAHDMVRTLLTEKQAQAAALEGIPARAQSAILQWFLE